MARKRSSETVPPGNGRTLPPPPELSADLWSDTATLGDFFPGRYAPPTRPEPEHVLAFWEWECQWSHFCERFGTSKLVAFGKSFWERIQGCDPLTLLCEVHPACLLHPVFLLLEDIHRGAFIRDRFRERERADEHERRRREAEKDLRRLRAARKAVERVPGWAVGEAERTRFLEILAAAEAVAERHHHADGPTEIRIILAREETVIRGADLKGAPVAPLKRGRPTDRGMDGSMGSEDGVNSRIFLLAEQVREIVGEKKFWPLTAILLKHFDPKSFPDYFGPGNASARARLFKRTFRGILDTLRADLHHRLDRRLASPPDLL